MTILVLLGTQDRPFTRLTDAVAKAAETFAEHDFIVQSGHTPFAYDVKKKMPFMNDEEYQSSLDEADIVITHGGAGSMMNAIRCGKAVIAVARRKKYGEHQDDHQEQLVGELAKSGSLLTVQNMDDLPAMIEKAYGFVPALPPDARERIIAAIENFIDTV